MDPKRKREIEVELELRRRKALSAQSGEGEGGDDGEGETQPAPSTTGETAFDAIQGGTRGVTLGLNDVVAGLGAAAGDLYQSTVDGRPRNPDAYREGVEEERKRDAASRERSPRAFKRAELAGVVATAPLVAAKPVQLAARSASGAPIALGAVADAAAPALTRYGRAAATGALTGLGLGDVDKIEDVPGAAATGAALGLGGEALSSLVKSGVATGISPADVARTGSLKSADALKALIGKADDAVGFELPMFGGREAEKVLRRLGAGAADLPPPPTIPQDKTTFEFLQSLGDDFAPLPPAPAPVAKPNPLAALVDEPMPTMPARNPRTPLDQIPKAAPAPAADPLDDLVTARTPAASQALPEQMTSVVPVVTKNSSAGNIAKAVEAKAIELGTTDLATIANALKLPTTLVSDPLRNAVSRFAFREAVKGASSKAPAVVDDVGAALDDLAAEGRAPLDEASKRIIREAGASTKNTNPVALDDVGGRAPKVVAAVGQQEKWRGIYDSLKSPEQRAAFIQQLRNESGLPDDTIRQRLKLTLAEWRRTSFTR